MLASRFHFLQRQLRSPSPMHNRKAALKELAKLVCSRLGVLNCYNCPICGYNGQFIDLNDRRSAECWNCNSLERHRLQFCVLEEIFRKFDPKNKSAIQFAPDPLTNILRQKFLSFITADLDREDVDLILDLRQLSIRNDSFDFVFASHVLEHIDDDAAALAEVHRILKPGGIAVLPVPIVSEKTIEYPEPVPTEHYHVRAPGLDYFSKYQSVFRKVILRTSRHYPARFQTYAIEDRSVYPTKSMPYRNPMPGKKHMDIVPICRK